ncbi:dihydrolipoamide dehydrogenase [Neobacillus piezotolerans]|uniref:Dihydrolipoamide dehydrogenase n=1 Tax=Neobacillus piezotolerans TaxID=2259171 RepID=A0A3D8GMT1_9BACI|nr:NAD(P)/FAD-dependent oxidoreductase [Neobacillus piezotolerans]RDU35805.1 dihydrolipoamide dehydrogenase [Neobacillus piezotolerans]
MVVGEMANQADLIVIGGGPGGYHAAIRAAQLGRQVLLIEKGEMGGVCLNKGCIPSRVITEAAKSLDLVKKSDVLGIATGHADIQFDRLLEHRNKTIASLRAGVEALCKANKVQRIRGSAFFLSDTRIGVEEGDKYDVHEFNDAIIAAGVNPAANSKYPVSRRILNQLEISFLDEIPAHLAIYGSGTLPLEMAMAFRALGSEVTFLLKKGENLPFDSSISKELARIFKKEKIQMLKECVIKDVAEIESGVAIQFEGASGEKVLEATHFFYQEKQSPDTAGLGTLRIGIQHDSEGFIQVDSQCRTSVKNIYAVGDITGEPFLASKAIKQGKIAAEAACGLNPEADFHFLPKVSFTRPPIASVGMTEEEALSKKLEIKTSQFPLAANGFSAITGKKDGLIKIISEHGTDVILGIHIIGEGAHELIFGGVTGLEMGAREEDFVFPSYPHPGLAEALLEAAEGLGGKAVHLKPQKKTSGVDTESLQAGVSLGIK